MNTLTFTLKRHYGHSRFYPSCGVTTALVKIAERKCLGLDDLKMLHRAGLELEVIDDATGARMNFLGYLQLLMSVKVGAV